MKAHKETVKFEKIPEDTLEFLNRLGEENRQIFNNALGQAKEKCEFKKIAESYQTLRKEKQFFIPAKVAQNTCRNVINSIKGFFALRKKDKTAKFPKRFKKYGSFCTLNFDTNGGIDSWKLANPFMLVEGHLRFSIKQNRAGSERQVFYVPISEFALSFLDNFRLKTLNITKDDKKGAFNFCFTYAEEKENLFTAPNKEFLAIDLGIKDIAACYSSLGDHFSIENNTFRKLEGRIKGLQSDLDNLVNRSSKPMKSRRVSRMKAKLRALYNKVSNKNKDFQHKVSKKIVEHCVENNIDNLIVGDIKTKKCVHKFAKKLNKSTQGRGTLSRFKDFLKYKAVGANLSFWLINEAYTSQRNCLTGKIELDSDLSVREHELEEGFFVDRDLNGACNIAQRNKGLWSAHRFDKSTLLKLSRRFLDNSGCLKMKLV
jgi:IS605 OrfB family transposase